MDILRLGGLLPGGVGVAATAFGGEITLAATDTGGGIAGATPPGIAAATGTAVGATPGTMAPGIMGGMPGIAAGWVTTGIPATAGTPGTPGTPPCIMPACIAAGITGTAPVICCMGGIPAMAAGAILACGTMPGKEPGTMPGTMGTAPGIGTMGAAAVTGAAAAATVFGMTGTSGFETAAATAGFVASIGLRLPAPVGVSVGVVPVLNEANNEGGNALGTSMPRSFKLISLQAILNSLMFIFPSESVSAKALIREENRKNNNNNMR